MKLSTRVGLAFVALLVFAMIASPATASEMNAQQLAQLPYAITSTTASNLVHYQQAASGTATLNVSCRVERPEIVSQPEVDSRVVVKGEDSGAGSSECVDLQGDDFYHSGEMYFEYLNQYNVWVRVWDYTAFRSQTSTRGTSALPIVADYIYPVDHTATNHMIHRACYDLHTPQNFAPLCSEPYLFLSATARI
jgi:hypothetical protein